VEERLGAPAGQADRGADEPTDDRASSDVAARPAEPDDAPTDAPEQDDATGAPLPTDAPGQDDAPAGADAPDDAPEEADAPDDAPQDVDAAAPADDVATAPLGPPVAAPADGPAPGEPAEDEPEPHLDAEAHAHLLSEPLPPESVTETAVLYNVAIATLAPPDDGTPSDAPAAGPPPSAASPAAPASPDPDAEPARADAPAGASSGTREHAARHGHRRTRRERAAVVALATLTVGLAALTTYLWISATEWRDQADAYLRTAQQLGDELATTRSQLAGSQAELEAVRAQLSTAHSRIVQLADEKNQALDDWEITQQLVDYQQRVSEAAGGVALALDRCVQGQQELIGYLQQQADPTVSSPPYDPEQLAQFESDVEFLCQEASKANISLQLELAR
jgi:hypothetical protein